MSTLLFAGGGTGGHVFPMIAVADAVRALAPAVELVFVGTEKGLETKWVPERGYRLELVDVGPIRGGGALGAAKGALRAARSIPAARALLRRFAPSAVFSIGGYAAGPVSVAARSLGIPVALMEPNSAIGLSNRLVAPFVRRAYTAFAASDRHFPKGAVLRSGVPIRQGFRPVPYASSAAPRVLVIGGSQGSQALNETVPRALASVDRQLHVTHQCGAGRDQTVRSLYRELGMEHLATVVPFLTDMPEMLGAAHLVIGRAGANAVAEICAVGRPSLLIPYPFAGDHQRFNADELVAAGAALCILSVEATPARLASEIRHLFASPETLAQMAAAARALGKPDAAIVIAKDFLSLAGLSGGSSSEVPSPDAPDSGASSSSRMGGKGASH